MGQLQLRLAPPLSFPVLLGRLQPVLPAAAAATRHAVNITTRCGFQCRSRIQCGAHTLFDFEHPIAKAFATTEHGAACVSSSAKNAANAAAGFPYTQQLSLSLSLTLSPSLTPCLSLSLLLFPPFGAPLLFQLRRCNL